MQLKLQENRYPIQSKLLTHKYSIPLSVKTNDPIAVSANPTIVHSPTNRSRRHERLLHPIMKNVRNKPNTPTETRTIQSRTQIAAQNSELGSNNSTGYRIPILSQTRGSSHTPPQRTPPGSGEVLERDRGSKSPVSFQPPPRGANKIYKCDVVFFIGEARTKTTSQTQFPYNRPREEQIKSTGAMRYSSLKKTQTNDTSQTQFPYKL